MIRVFAIILAFVSLPAQAETVTVRSGEHAGFSRLVLNGDIGRDWTFGTVDGGFEFRPDRDDLTWNLSQVFKKISRDHVRAVSDLGAGRLFIEVGCACHANAFVLRDGQVVIDIKNGSPPPALSEFNEALPALTVVEESVAPSEQSGRFTQRDLVGDRAGLPLLLPGLVAPPNADVPPEVEVAEDSDATGAVPSDATARVATTEAALLEQLARAAAQGMIEADVEQIGNAAALPEKIVPDASVTPPPSVLPPPATPRGHVSIETGVDRAAPATESAPATDDGDTCLAPSLFDVARWGGAMNGADIGAFRSALLGEFDRADSTALTDLAHHYLYLSFGAETEALLRQYPDRAERPDILFVMAEVMDAGHAQDAAWLQPQMACDGATALWATLAQDELRPGQSINVAAVALAFSSLPPHLRSHLGPDLADKLLDIGEVETAERIRKGLQRVSRTDDPALELTTARLDLAQGDAEHAAATLDPIATQDSDLLPEVLIARVAAALAGGGALAPDQVALLQSFAFEHRGTALGARLLVAEVQALAMAGDFGATFLRLDNAKNDPGVSEARGEDLAAEVFSALSENAADPVFLVHATGHLESALSLPAPERRMLAERFLALGLTEPARHLLGGQGALPDEADRVLFARAALAENRPDVAVGYLAGLKGEDVDLLRAEALEAAGDYGGAVRMFDAAGNAARATWSAWRGGMWGDLAGRDTGTLSTAAHLMLPAAETTPAPNETTTPLAGARQLIAQSGADRAALTELLDTIAPLPLPPGS